jgi:hypothetical protein
MCVKTERTVSYRPGEVVTVEQNGLIHHVLIPESVPSDSAGVNDEQGQGEAAVQPSQKEVTIE